LYVRYFYNYRASLYHHTPSADTFVDIILIYLTKNFQNEEELEKKERTTAVVVVAAIL